MTAVIVAVAGIALLAALAVAVAWQEQTRPSEGAIVYGVEESISFVMDRLSSEAAAVLKAGDVRRMLEWSVRYLQDPSARDDPSAPPVAGGLEAARYVQERSIDAGVAYDAPLVLEVLQLQTEFLGALGAVGDHVVDPASDGEPDG